MIVRAGDRAIHRAGLERFVHDLADGAGAAAALGAATQATIDLAGGAGTLFRLTGGPNILVAQYIAGTDDHGRINGPRMGLSIA